MNPKKIPKTVWVLGIVSFFNDLASEMIYPIVPIFLTAILHTPVPLVGVIEGISEATASVTKFLFGAYSDYLRRRKVFIVLGYTFGAISKALIGAAGSWPVVLGARFIDRTGKGLRTAPRDSLLLDNATPGNRGFIFGFHRSMDSLGAVVGPLAGLSFLYILKDNMRLTFFIACIPAFIGVILLLVFIREPRNVKGERPKNPINLKWSLLSPRLKWFMVISFLFSVGNSSDAFLILNAKRLGFTTTMAVLSYVLYNVSQTVFATPAGKLADRIGARRVLLYGLIIFAFTYLAFGAIQSARWMWVLFPVYGLYIAFTDGVSKAYVSEFVTERNSATFFGFHQMLLAIGTFLASFIGGMIWSAVGPSATFYYGAAMAAAACVLFIVQDRMSLG